jgi:hypothetical protein
MRIGTFDTLKKTVADPGGDLLAYFAATVMRNDDDPVYAGCLDLLIARKPHAFRSLGARFLAELIEATSRRAATVTGPQESLRIAGQAHALGHTTHFLPWGIVVTKAEGAFEV